MGTYSNINIAIDRSMNLLQCKCFTCGCITMPYCVHVRACVRVCVCVCVRACASQDLLHGRIQMKTLTNKWYEEVRQGPSGSEDDNDEAELL